MDDAVPLCNVEINNKVAINLYYNKIKFSDVDYNRFNMHYRKKLTFNYNLCNGKDYFDFKVWLCKDGYKENDSIAKPVSVRIRKQRKEDVRVNNTKL